MIQFNLSCAQVSPVCVHSEIDWSEGEDLDLRLA